MLEEAGFEDVVVRDLAENVMPMLQLVFMLAYVPYVFVKLLGVKFCFVHTVVRIEVYGEGVLPIRGCFGKET